MTPADCDLRSFPWMQLDVLRLRESTVASLESAEAFRCGMILYCASWHEIPAGSLPNDDAQLARLAGYGRDMKAFRLARAKGGMRGWVLCSDGRWYHPVVAEKALASWDKKLAQKSQTGAARKALAEKKKELAASGAPPEMPLATESVTDRATESVTDRATESVTDRATESVTSFRSPVTGSRVRELEIEKEDSVLRTGAPAAPTADARADLLKHGVPLVRALLGKSDDASRKLIGRFLRDARDDCPRVLAVLREAADLRPVDPAAWITKALQNRRQTRTDESKAKLARFIAGIEDDPETPPQPLLVLLP